MRSGVLETTTVPAARNYTAAWPAALSLLFDRLLFLFVFITVFLPSGTVYGLNLKLPMYAALLPLAVYSLFMRSRATPARLATVLGLPALLAFWVGLALARGFGLAGALRQYTDIVLTMLLCWLVLLFCGDDDARKFRFLRLVLFSEVCASLLKSGLIAYALLRGIPVPQVVDAVSKVFGVNLMTMDLGALFGRVQFVSDALIPIAMFIVLRHRDRLGIGSWRAAATMLLLTVSVLFSFSRFFWAYTVLALLLGLALGRRDRFQLVLLIILGVSVLASLPALSLLYDLRFSQTVSGSSDSERVEQEQALTDFFFDAPLLGHGLGSYTHAVIRANDTEAGRYSYELQLLALAGQVGLAGLAIFAAVLGWYYRRLWTMSSLPLKDRAGVALLLLFWLAAGLYNPLLLNPVAGVSYAALAALASVGNAPRPRVCTATPALPAR